MSATASPYRFIVSVDLGQAGDYTCVAVLKRTWHPPARPHFDCVALERLALGTPYPAVVSHVRGLAGRSELRPVDRVVRPGGRAVNFAVAPDPLVCLDRT